MSKYKDTQKPLPFGETKAEVIIIIKKKRKEEAL